MIFKYSEKHSFPKARELVPKNNRGYVWGFSKCFLGDNLERGKIIPTCRIQDVAN
jgi:hypothetical protein